MNNTKTNAAAFPNVISFDKFAKAVNSNFANSQTKNTYREELNDFPSKKLVEYFFVKVDYSLVKVCIKDIKYVEGFKDYIKIYTNDKSLITKSTIKHLESKLPNELFARVHKSYIISLDKIDKIENNQIYIGIKKIPIGLQYKDSFYERINDLKL
jgi:two-component system, LytTR family, response regulator